MSKKIRLSEMHSIVVIIILSRKGVSELSKLLKIKKKGVASSHRRKDLLRSSNNSVIIYPLIPKATMARRASYSNRFLPHGAVFSVYYDLEAAWILVHVSYVFRS